MVENLSVQIPVSAKKELTDAKFFQRLGEANVLTTATRREHVFIAGICLFSDPPQAVMSDIFPGEPSAADFTAAWNQIELEQAVPLVFTHSHPSGTLEYSPRDVKRWLSPPPDIILMDTGSMDFKSIHGVRPVELIISPQSSPMPDRVMALAQTAPAVDLSDFVDTGLSSARLFLQAVREANPAGDDYAAVMANYQSRHGVALSTYNLTSKGKRHLKEFIHRHTPNSLAYSPYDPGF